MEVMFIVYALFIYIISNGIGKLLLKEEHRLYLLRSLIGFVCLLFVLQLGYYPMQYFHLSSTFVFIFNCIVLTFGFIIGIKQIKKADFFFLKSWIFYVLLILIFFIIKIIPATEAGDDWFYMPMIMDNIGNEQINSINPRSGWDWNIGELWQYQGYYLFTSFFYQIQSLLQNGIEAIFVSFRSTFTLLMIIYSSIIIGYIEEMFPKVKKTFIWLVQFTTIVLISFLEWSHLYWGSFACFPTFFPLLLLLLNEYALKRTKRLVLLICITNGAMLSLFSSALFLNVFLMISFYGYCALKKKIYFEDYALMLLSSFLYLCFFLGKPYLFVVVVIIYYLIYKIKKNKINQFLNSYSIYIIFLLPIIIAIVSFILGMSFTWSLYRLGTTFLIFNLVICAVILYMWVVEKKVNPMTFAFLIFNLVFFNPIVCPFIARFFTSDQVYYRLFYITKNPVMIACILLYLYRIMDFKKLISIGYQIGVILICGYYSFVMLRNINFDVLPSSSYNYLLREDKDVLEAGEFLHDQKQYHGTNVYSIYLAPRMFDTSYKTKVIRYPKVSEDTLVVDAMFQDESLSNERYIEFKNTLYRENVHLLITYNNDKVKSRLQFLSKIVYENDTFVIYEVTIK